MTIKISFPTNVNLGHPIIPLSSKNPEISIMIKINELKGMHFKGVCAIRIACQGKLA